MIHPVGPVPDTRCAACAVGFEIESILVVGEDLFNGHCLTPSGGEGLGGSNVIVCSYP